MNKEKEISDVKIKDSCLLCSKKFEFNEIITIKMPENSAFCTPCLDRFEDNNKYKGIDQWVVIKYQPGIVFSYKPKVPGE